MFTGTTLKSFLSSTCARQDKAQLDWMDTRCNLRVCCSILTVVVVLIYFRQMFFSGICELAVDIAGLNFLTVFWNRSRFLLTFDPFLFILYKHDLLERIFYLS